MLRALFGFALSAAALGQSFDAASIRPAPRSDISPQLQMGPSGGPGTDDPGLFKCSGCTVRLIVLLAWDIRQSQLSGAIPLDGDRFDIAARVPGGATREQFRAMLQNLLAERFKLAVHHENRELPVFELVVSRNGPKFKESLAGTIKPSAPLAVAVRNGGGHLQANGTSINELARVLASPLGGRPVIDGTGLTGQYDFALTWTLDDLNAADPGSLPNIFSAVGEQLGLKLQSKKSVVDIVVVDRVDKTPLEN